MAVLDDSAEANQRKCSRCPKRFDPALFKQKPDGSFTKACIACSAQEAGRLKRKRDASKPDSEKENVDPVSIPTPTRTCCNDAERASNKRKCLQ
ncbi:hypothetical protein EXIGLDRAFT_761307 [Exidia glandulosa HHB12029]|uniref:Stc1 domain-containing protein n=1 Tax=Exidia glandulosa HHB12029 TaxID=1314781 RepID=A0A166BG42_EXIGL|nr:hypothetical protein EXIGLDRAFT_761307 [Exidia glandulosa HHB12029]